MIIAVDFDGTLFTNGFPEIGIPNLVLINKLIKMKEQGHQLILWTCRGGEWLEEAIEECKNYGLEFDAINENVKGFTYVNISCKVVADVYLDDRNISIKDFINDR